MMMLNVWGVIWRIQKRLIAWTKANAENGTPMPDRAQRMARIAFLTLARQRLSLNSDAVLYGGSQPLPDVRGMIVRALSY